MRLKESGLAWFFSVWKAHCEFNTVSWTIVIIFSFLELFRLYSFIEDLILVQDERWRRGYRHASRAGIV
jgi:hypothetical protein